MLTWDIPVVKQNITISKSSSKSWESQGSKVNYSDSNTPVHSTDLQCRSFEYPWQPHQSGLARIWTFQCEACRLLHKSSIWLASCRERSFSFETWSWYEHWNKEAHGLEIDGTSSSSCWIKQLRDSNVSLKSSWLTCRGLAWQINLTFAKHIDAARDPMFDQFINRIRLEWPFDSDKLTVVKTAVHVSRTCPISLSTLSYRRLR